MDIRKLNSSPSMGLFPILLHCSPRPCSSKRARYSVPNPNATGDSRLCSEAKRAPKMSGGLSPHPTAPLAHKVGTRTKRVVQLVSTITQGGRKAVSPQKGNSGNASGTSHNTHRANSHLFNGVSLRNGKDKHHKAQRTKRPKVLRFTFLPCPPSSYLLLEITQLLIE